MNSSVNQTPLKVPRKARRQISLGVMMVLMLVFTLMSIGLFYATRIEAIQNELSLVFGASAFDERETSRRSHLIFLLFTYASPLMLALVLATANNFLNRRRG
jgi:hypothetical protein